MIERFQGDAGKRRLLDALLSQQAVHRTPEMADDLAKVVKLEEYKVGAAFIEQDADFLAAVQIIVYAGAIVVLFLFVIMFLGVDRREDVNVEPLTGQRTLAFLMVGITLAGVIAMLATSHWVTGAHQVVGPIQGPVTKASGAPSGEVAQLGKQLFTTYLFAFEATAALLVIAVVGAVVLARRPAVSERAEREALAERDAGDQHDAHDAHDAQSPHAQSDPQAPSDQSDQSERGVSL